MMHILGASHYVECSALIDQGVHEVFNLAAKVALHKPCVKDVERKRCLLI